MFWDNLKAELDNRNISLKELAAKAGLQQQSIYNAINRGNIPTLDTACKIAKVLKMSVEELYTGNNYSGLNDEELALIIRYRKLKEEDKASIKKIVAALEKIT